MNVQENEFSLPFCRAHAPRLRNGARGVLGVDDLLLQLEEQEESSLPTRQVGIH